MDKRIAIMFSIIIFISSILLVRIYLITENDNLKQAADIQSSYTLDVTTTRGTIYDCKMRPLVNKDRKYMAAVSPTPESFQEISKKLIGNNRKYAIDNLHNGKPFLLPIKNSNYYARGIKVFKLPIRYSDDLCAKHIIGYCDGDGNGVCGIELAFDKQLAESGSDISIKYTTDTTKKPLPSYLPEVEGNPDIPNQGIVLTIDQDIQKIAEKSMRKIESGAAVVMDITNGEIKAAVSMPDFNPTNISDSLDKPLSPLLNRCFIPYSVGSTFKIVVAMAALEQGISTDFSAYCKGYTEVNGIRFGCHYSAGHRWCDMERGLMWSCNPYFIKLGLAIDTQGILSVASAIGFGKETELAPNMYSAAGYLPVIDEIVTKPDIANLSFGQGKLMATPIQIAQMICTSANGGKSVVPSIVKGVTADGKNVYIENNKFQNNTVVSPETAETIRKFLISVVEKGSGENAKPNYLGAGGKTASAQTGQYISEEETVHAWFAGFYPADLPKYAIVVLDEGGILGGEAAAPVFKEICNELFLLDS